MNNPIRFIDPDGMSTTSTDVTKNADGTYKVVAAKVDGDKNVYVQNAAGQRTGTVIGKTLTDHSFLDDNGKAVTGATINLSDRSGPNFLKTNVIGNKKLGLFDYMANATGGGKYDFKTNGIAARPDGTSIDQYKYRGMPVDGISGVGENGVTPTIASARDIGNVGAGYVAGDNGTKWADSRLAFDALQSVQQGKMATEGATTQLAERVGFNKGYADWAKEHPVQNLFRNDESFPAH